MLHQNTENKEVGLRVEPNVVHNSAITNADLVRILPKITSGVDGSSRLGDRVKPLSLKVKGIVSINENPNTNPFYVRVMMLSQKDVKTSSGIGVGTDPDHLLRCAIPGASEIPFSGNRQELNYPVNDNKFRVYFDKQYLIAPVSTVGLSAGNSAQFSQFKFAKTIKGLPAHLSFDEGNGDDANNFAPFLAIGYAYADGTAPDVTVTRISTEIYSKLTYEDA